MAFILWLGHLDVWQKLKKSVILVISQMLEGSSQAGELQKKKKYIKHNFLAFLPLMSKLEFKLFGY